MAFDQSTRNRLQKFVNDARNLLTEEFTRQLQATYGLDPKAGSVAAVDSLTHLDNRQRQTANVLRDTLAHYLATTHGKGEKDRTEQALNRIVREQAFTVLNRLAALRMAETRGFLLETIAHGYNAKGFQLYKQLAGSALGETGEAYRNYLFSVFDEFSLDLAVLFDRHSAQGRLFPRESALLELLDLINHHEIEPLWAEDETIGWIYQYFNSQEERKKMRAESQAPRNSRELAVRNQFFTPRYVVEFLTDNTLGRIWYEMTQGNTGLVESCRYLVRRPTELFLKPGELAPEQEESAGKTETLSQEELLKQPVYIPHRAIKDPRCIRMLDPACGSMHFGLYAFDLYERIYEEAWQLEAELGAEAFVREGDLKSLHQSYDSFEDYRAEIPRLIIEHNIHGVDIDPRAVQIAGLSLWQRAQRAWQQQGIKPQRRPVVRKSNIVCAEPMPGEKALLQEFSSSLNPPVLGQLVEAIFDKMELVGEAGTLLKIEEEIQSSIHEARDQWQAQSGSNSVSDMFQAELDQATPQKKLGFDLSGVDDESFWDGAEQLILDALSNYADKAESNADQKRLFAEDASKGFAFIDLCRKRFDAVLMNPPFGDSSSDVNSYLKRVYNSGRPDLYMCFIYRSEDLLNEKGKHGSITSRTFLTLQFFKGLREKLLSEDLSMQLLLDTGSGVLDGATVETCCLVAERKRSVQKVQIYDVASTDDKQLKLISCVERSRASKLENSTYIVSQEVLRNTPGSLIAYKIPTEVLALFTNNLPIDPKYAMQDSVESRLVANVRQGLIPGDQFRFTRSPYEIPIVDLQWSWCAKGGEYANFVSKEDIKINWLNDGAEIKAFAKQNYGGESRTIKNTSFFFKPGISFPRVSSVGLNARVLSGSYTFSDTGMAVLPEDLESAFNILVFLNSDLANYLSQLLHPGRKFEIAHVASLPVSGALLANHELRVIGEKLVKISYLISTIDPEQFSYKGPFWRFYYQEPKVLGRGFQDVEDIEQFFFDMVEHANRLVNSIFGISEDTADEINESAKPLVLARKKLFNKLRGYYPLKGDGKLALNENLVVEYYLRYKFMGGYALSGDRYRKLIETLSSNTAFTDLLDEIDVDRDSTVSTISDDSIFCTEDLDVELYRKDVANQLGDLASLGISQVFDIDWKSYLVNPRSFFEHHLKVTSFGGRQAPIYWPLQTLSGSYTLWVYYHGLKVQTLYTCVNDFVGPKLEQAEKDLNTLTGKATRSSQEEKELEIIIELVTDLRDFRDELLRVAKFWKPNLNDGVQITAAPLWKLFQHKAWQKRLKETWEKLEKGDYDWAHLACSIWPERVLRKCHQDRSLAIAHDVEDSFWHEVEVPVKRGKKATGETKLEWQPKDLTYDELNALIQAKIMEKKA